MLQRFVLVALALLPLSVSLSQAREKFPESPSLETTPGLLCQPQQADQYRYPERIPYCSRDVSSETKDRVIDLYESRFGYAIREVGRRQFKIDHYIPLCMGGSNDMGNLWPQHLSISERTDALEQESCKKMSEGRLLQVKAIQYIREAKAAPERAAEILRQVQAL